MSDDRECAAASSLATTKTMNDLPGNTDMAELTELDVDDVSQFRDPTGSEEGTDDDDRHDSDDGSDDGRVAEGYGAAAVAPPAGSPGSAPIAGSPTQDAFYFRHDQATEADVAFNERHEGMSKGGGGSGRKLKGSGVRRSPSEEDVHGRSSGRGRTPRKGDGARARAQGEDLPRR